MSTWCTWCSLCCTTGRQQRRQVPPSRSYMWQIMAAQIAHVWDGVLRQPDRANQGDISVGTPAWWRRLEAETARSFALQGPQGHFTATTRPQPIVRRCHRAPRASALGALWR